MGPEIGRLMYSTSEMGAGMLMIIEMILMKFVFITLRAPADPTC